MSVTQQSGSGSSTTQSVRDQVQSAAGQAQEQVQQAAGQARSRVQEQIDTRSTQAGERIGSTAEDLRTIAGELRNQDKQMPADLAEQLADRVERVGAYLKDADADRMLSDVERLARRQPWAFAAGGLVLGLIASRFVKASSSRRFDASGGYTSTRSREEIKSEVSDAALGIGTVPAPVVTEPPLDPYEPATRSSVEPGSLTDVPPAEPVSPDPLYDPLDERTR
jgi:hypothetical protein